MKGQEKPVISYLDALKLYLKPEDYKYLTPVTDLAVFTTKKKEQRLCVNCWDHKEIRTDSREEKKVA